MVDGERDARCQTNSDGACATSKRPCEPSKSLGERFLIGPHSLHPLRPSSSLLRPARAYSEHAKLFLKHSNMGRLKQKGKAGAAKAYVTRSSAIKKLQCSLADFRRLCILKGTYSSILWRKANMLNSASQASTPESPAVAKRRIRGLLRPQISTTRRILRT